MSLVNTARPAPKSVSFVGAGLREFVLESERSVDMQYYIKHEKGRGSYG